MSPDLSTLPEAGLPGLEAATWNVVVAPAGTPHEIVERLNRDIGETLKQPGMSARLRHLNMEPADDVAPTAVKAFIEAEIAESRAVVELYGARID